MLSKGKVKGFFDRLGNTDKSRSAAYSSTPDSSTSRASRPDEPEKPSPQALPIEQLHQATATTEQPAEIQPEDTVSTAGHAQNIRATTTASVPPHFPSREEAGLRNSRPSSRDKIISSLPASDTQSLSSGPGSKLPQGPTVSQVMPSQVSYPHDRRPNDHTRATAPARQTQSRTGGNDWGRPAAPQVSRCDVAV